MKKILIPVILLIIVMLVVVIYPISVNYSKVQFGKDAQFHMTAVQEGGKLTAEYSNTTTNVVGRNLSRLYSVLSVSDIKPVYGKPEWDEDNAIYLNFSSGAEYIIAEDPSVKDGIFFFYTYKNKNVKFKASGYNSFIWTKKAISPSGIYNPNEIIE